MKTGRTITELAQELERQGNAKRDFVADTRTCGVIVDAEQPRLEDNGLAMMVNGDNYPIQPLALRQIGDRLKIPAKYVDRLASDHPDMLAYNINALFSREPEKRMVRTMDGNVRAFLSDRYRPMDHADLAEAVLPHLIEHGAVVESCDITDTKMYVKAIHPGLEAELPPPKGAEMGVGHTMFIEKVQAGITIANSETGHGRLLIQPCTFTKRCTNWAIFKDNSFGRTHLGQRQGDGREFWEILSDDTRKVSDEALWAQVNDIVKASLDGTIFHETVERLKASREDTIEKPVIECIEVFTKKNALTDTEGQGILQHLIQGGDLTRYGLSQAVTRFSADVEDYDRATEFERLGGKVIELPKTDWAALAKAA